MALEVLNNKKYDILDSIVEDIHNKCIKMDREEKQALVERFQRVLDKFIKKMKEADPLFSETYNRIGYTGSFFEGLRVGEATEYDLNLILKPKLKIKADKRGSLPGFISVVVEEPYNSLPKHYKHWSKSLGPRVLLDPNLVSSWLQGVVQKTVTKINAEEGNSFEDCAIHLIRKSGPAWTLVIVSHQYPMKTIDVDLVPVLEFPCSQWPVARSRTGSYTDTWFAVPKPPRGSYSAEWRLSFPDQEAKLIRGLEFLKYTLRLLKRVRDQFEFKAIASYYIKTLFLWEVEQRDRGIWMRNRRGRLFIYMLIRLKEALDVKAIPFFWDQGCNLIEHVQYHCLVNFHGRLRRFLKDIDHLIDTQNHQQLDKLISEQLSTPEEIMEELQTAREPSCTIL